MSLDVVELVQKVTSWGGTSGDKVCHQGMSPLLAAHTWSKVQEGELP